MPLSDAQVEELKTRWPGESAAQIARSFGVTRNTVLGKLHRMKLLGTGLVRPRQHQIGVRARPALPKPAAPIVPPLGDELGETSITIADASMRVCHWGIGDPRDGQFRFCGRPGFPYCEGHRTRAYQPQDPSKKKGPKRK
jgi:GcrA cell cycle regulator